MFKANMIAPCGLDCNICSQALIGNDPCQGCNGPDDHKPEFCARYCGIILCRKRKEYGYRFCDECPEYPCEDVMEKENRYTSKYPHRESPLENLRMIRRDGMDAFLEYERQQWTCPNCGRPFSDMSELWKAVFGSRQELSALWEKCAWHRCLDRFWCCWHFLMMIELGWNTAETEICSG